MNNISNKRLWLSDFEYEPEVEATTPWFTTEDSGRYRKSTGVIIMVNYFFEVQKMKIAKKGIQEEIVTDLFKDINRSNEYKLKILYTRDIANALKVFEKLKDLYCYAEE